MRSVVAFVGLTLTTGKGTCQDYFGDVSGLVTVVDVTDADGDDCSAAGHSSPCTWVHYGGLKTKCYPPGPADGCHRYVKTRYKREDRVCAGALARLNLTWSVDVDDVFTKDGVYSQNGCSDASVLSQEIHCYKGPPDEPQSCECPSTLV